jgi:FKBP-type peptidyl-prolyl cis-trans isomerase FkpA
LGLPLIKKGGVIRLIIPSSLAYGCNAAGSIPGDSVLYFEVELVDVL